MTPERKTDSCVNCGAPGASGRCAYCGTGYVADGGGHGLGVQSGVEPRRRTPTGCSIVARAFLSALVTSTAVALITGEPQLVCVTPVAALATASVGYLVFQPDKF